MEKEVIYNSNLHFEHVQWRSELAFWEDELKSFKKRLEELVVNWTDKTVLAQLEHYQNQFIIQKEVIDTLKHEINVHEDHIVSHIKKGEDVLEHSHVNHHVEFRSRMETQRHIYAELKKDFYRFLTKYM